MVTIRTKDGKRKTYKNYVLSVGAYSKNGKYVTLVHKRTGNKRKFKL